MPDTNEIHVQKPVKSDRIIRAGDDKNIDSALMETEAQVLQHQQDRAIQLRLEELGITDKSFSVQMPVGSVPATDSPIPVVGSRLSWKRTLILAAVALLIAVATLIWLVIGNGTNHSQFRWLLNQAQHVLRAPLHPPRLYQASSSRCPPPCKRRLWRPRHWTTLKPKFESWLRVGGWPGNNATSTLTFSTTARSLRRPMVKRVRTGARNGNVSCQ